jgi:hypothetical protein
MEAWAGREGLNPLELNANMADHFIRELKAEGKAPATTRRDIAAVSVPVVYDSSHPCYYLLSSMPYLL